MTRAELRSALLNANVLAFLRAIRLGEGTLDDLGYYRLVGGGEFSDDSHHPNRRVWIEKYQVYSTAAGAYQIINPTWQGLVRQYHFPNFSPECQDEAAVALIVGRHALADVMAGELEDAIRKCNPEWASLPGSSSGQRQEQYAAIERVYVDAGGTSRGMKSFPVLPLALYADVRPLLQNGDILLASGEYPMSKLIQAATGSVWSHVAVLLWVESIDRLFVMESIEGRGTRTIPLSQYVGNFEGSGKGYNGRIAIARHDNFSTAATPDALKLMSQALIDRFGYPYDDQEIATITTRIVTSAMGMEPVPYVPDEHDICSEYVDRGFRALGLHCPYDSRGFIAPADIAKWRDVSLLWEIKTAS